jgi:hypothetical protein
MVDALELADEHASASFSCSCQGAHGGFAKYPNVEARCTVSWQLPALRHTRLRCAAVKP